MYKITSYSGFFYVVSITTGKVLIENSFRSYDDAKRAGDNLKKPLNKTL